MRCRTFLLIVSLLPACAAAQSAAPQSAGAASTAKSDTWSKPAPASSVSYAGNPARALGDEGASHFKFKDRSRDAAAPQVNAALQQSGKAAVGIGTQVQSDGRPAVDCVRTPMDSACR